MDVIHPVREDYCRVIFGMLPSVSWIRLTRQPRLMICAFRREIVSRLCRLTAWNNTALELTISIAFVSSGANREPWKLKLLIITKQEKH